MWRLESDCHDQYQDDVAAVRADLLRHADLPIANVRGWDPRSATVEVVGLLLGRDAVTGEADGGPSREAELGERAGDLMADPARTDRVVAAVLEILGEG